MDDEKDSGAEDSGACASAAAAQTTTKRSVEIVTVNSSLRARESFSFKLSQLDLRQWLDEPGSFKHRFHMIYAATTGGKTMFGCSLIYAFIKHFSAQPGKQFRVFVISDANTDDTTNKLLTMQHCMLGPDVGSRMQIFKIDTMALLAENFEEITEEKMKFQEESKRRSSPLFGKRWDPPLTIYYFDDAANMLKSSSSGALLTKLLTTGRHFKITGIINTQIIKCLPDAVKSQLASISILGHHSVANIDALIKYFPAVASVFQTTREYSQFSKWYLEKCKPYTCITIKEKHRTVFLYKLQQHLVEMFNTKPQILPSAPAKKPATTAHQRLSQSNNNNNNNGSISAKKTTCPEAASYYSSKAPTTAQSYSYKKIADPPVRTQDCRDSNTAKRGPNFGIFRSADEAGTKSSIRCGVKRLQQRTNKNN